MAYTRVGLLDPTEADPAWYDWQVNYSEEDGFGRERSIQRTATTDGVGVVRQQGDTGPIVISVMGTIFHKAQHERFIRFFNRSANTTFIFRDFEGEEFEVMMTAYRPVRKRTLRNPRDPSIPLHYYTYSMSMEVVRVISGSWLGAAL